MMLSQMRDAAEAYLGVRVQHAVISVPASFNYSQQQAIRDAGLIAGLNILRIIHQTSLAVIGYGFDKKVDGPEKNVLCFNLGASTCDVSIVTREDGICEVKAVCGLSHLGGEDFDNCLVNHFVQEFRHKTKKDLSLSTNLGALQRLRIACEGVKRRLSSSFQTSFELFDDSDFYTVINRDQFEEYCQDLFRSILELIEKAIHDAFSGDKQSIDEILLIGGSTRIPRIQSLISEFFNGKELNKSLNLEESVAVGAAVQAAILVGQQRREDR